MNRLAAVVLAGGLMVAGDGIYFLRGGGPDREIGLADMNDRDHPAWVQGVNGLEIADKLRRFIDAELGG